MRAKKRVLVVLENKMGVATVAIGLQAERPTPPPPPKPISLPRLPLRRRM